MMNTGMRTILIVEDDEILRDLLAEHISNLGYACHVASNGAEGLNQFTASKPHAIVADITMPHLSGTDMLLKIRSMGSQVPIVLITGDVRAEVMLKAIRLGATDFLEKPFSAAQVEKVVVRVLEIDARQEANRDILKQLEAVSAHTGDLIRKYRKNEEFIEQILAQSVKT